MTNQKILLILILVSTILIGGCSNKIPQDDSFVIPRDKFEIFYSFGVGEQNILDTKNNLYVKDMICNKSKQYSIKLNDSEKNDIYSAIVKNDILNIKDDFTKNCILGICQDITPLSGSTLKIEYGGKTKTIEWRANYFYKNDQDLKKFMNVEKVILDIIHKKELEMNIEQPKCGYL